MRKLFVMCLGICLVGCASITAQPYIPDRHPYTQKFYKPFDEVVSTVKSTLSDSGWNIGQRMDPEVYERNPAMESSGGKQLLFFAQCYRRGWIMGTRTDMLNVYFREQSPSMIEVEIRYRRPGRIFRRSFSYRNDELIKTMLDSVEKKFAVLVDGT